MKNKMLQRFKKKTGLIAAFCFLALSLSACSRFDVIGNEAIDKMKQVINDTPIEVTETDINYELQAPDGMAKLSWSKNGKEDIQYDISLSISIEPFVKAGMKPELLPEGTVWQDTMVYGFKSNSKSKETVTSAADRVAELLDQNRDRIEYHSSLGHFLLNLSEQASFEWAQDMQMNDKDIVFALNPDMLMKAGLNPNQVEGWTYAAVEVMNENGEMVETMKLLKAFQLQ